MHTVRRVLVAATTLSLLAVAPVQPAAAAPPSAPYTVMTVAGSREVLATLENTEQFRVEPFNGTNGFFVDAGLAAGSQTITIKAPEGQVLDVGTFSTNETGDATHGHLTLAGMGDYCAAVDGRVTVHELVRGAGDAIVSLAVSYEAIRCGTGNHPPKGEIRWNSAVGYTVAQAITPITFRALDFGQRNAGELSADAQISFKSVGSGSLSFGAATIAGSNPEAFVISWDACAGAVVGYEQACVVSLQARPTALGGQSATLEIPSNTVGGKEVVRLSVSGVKSARGTFHAVSPTRILDTRFGTGAMKAKVGPDRSIDVAVSNHNGVPISGVAAVVLNVTVTEPTTSGHITVWPTAVPRPNASSLNFVAGWTGANSVTVGVGFNGKVSFYNSMGSTHLIADVVGYYLDSTLNPIVGAGGLLHFGEPYRRLDTRTWGLGKLESGYSAILRTNFFDEETNTDDNAHIKAWVVNITATESEGPGYVTAWSGHLEPPNASNLNLVPGKTVSNFAIVPSGRCWECTGETYGWQTIEIFTSMTTHLIVDMFALYDDGTYTSGLRLEPNNPTRIVDSRFAQGTPGPLAAGATAVITTPSSSLGDTTEGLALNVTAVAPTANTFITVWGGDGITQPVVSNLNPGVGQVIPNAVATRLDSPHTFKVYNNAGSTHFVVDVVGTYYWYPYGDAVLSSGRGAPTARPDWRLGPVDMRAERRKVT